jgi:cytochrome c2
MPIRLGSGLCKKAMPEKLFAFFTNPKQLVPGSKMPSGGTLKSKGGKASLPI